MSSSKPCQTIETIETWRVFPRVFYFLNRYNGLVPRFKKLIGAFPPSFHEEELIFEIESIQKVFQNAFNVIVVSVDSLKLEDILVTTEPLECQGVHDAKMPPCITMYICYIVIDGLNEAGWEKVSSTLDFFNDQYGHKDVCVFDSLFIVIEITMTTELQTELTKQVSNKIKSVYPKLSHSDRILVSQGAKGEIRHQLSLYLESELMLGFHKILRHLQMFIGHNKQSILTSMDIAENIEKENCVARFLLNHFNIEETQSVALSDMSAELLGKTVDEKFEHILCTRLSVLLKCKVVDLASVKYNLVPWQVNILLNELKFEKSLFDSISESTKTELRKLNEKSSFRKLLCNSINDSLINDVGKTVLDTEGKLKNMTTAITVFEKMIFEVKGYLKETKTDFNIETSTPPLISDTLRQQLLLMKDVFGVGMIYNTLEVHVKSNSSEVKKNIDDLMQKHSFLWKYTVKSVNQQFQRFGNAVHENGAMIKSVYITQSNQTESKTGTLGCFVADDYRNLYALTSAHVISRPNVNSSVVFIHGKSSNILPLGQSQSELTIYSDESSNSLIDIAAIPVLNETANSCMIYPKDDQGINCHGDIYRESLSPLTGKFVFKYGAMSNLTQGIVCSTDFSVFGNDDYLLMIENLMGSDAVFACPGDSGAIICRPDIDSDRVNLISMLIGGDYKVGGDITPRYLAFSLRHGLQHLSDKSGVRFSVPC
ncbi:hypothetical protein ACF0H5_007141 [Mactra antiquata]